MPSPVGHMLGGAAAGGLIAGRSLPRWTLLAFAAAGAVADLDLLAGIHSGPTHSLSWALMAGVIAWTLWLTVPPRTTANRTGEALRVAVAVAAAYASHPLLDWLSTDTRAPFGIMALWPLSSAHYISPVHVFLPVSRRYWLVESWWMNLRAVLREVLILGPLFWIAWSRLARTSRRSEHP